MKVPVSFTVTALLFAGATQAQTPPGQAPAQPVPAPPTSGLTLDLNSGPPAPAVYLVPEPAAPDEPAPETANPVAPPIAAPRATPTPVTPPEPAAAPSPRAPEVERFRIPEPFVAPPEMQPPRLTPIPTTPSAEPRTAPITPPTATPVPAPRVEPLVGETDRAPPATPPAPARTVAPETSEAAAAPPPPAAPSLSVLDSAARAALPFTADLPPGFEIVTGRPGPDFRIYTIRRGDRSFVMVYAGPASQFPIYSGQMVEAGGRASIVATENGVRHAVEHLFQRSAAPREIHIWTMSLDGADRAMAEQIAQTIDVR